MSNYPPGVTGSEYAIAGPDSERSVEVDCPKCGHTEGVIASYGSGWWTACEGCGEILDEGYIDPSDRWDNDPRV